jgi:hypothetical protein
MIYVTRNLVIHRVTKTLYACSATLMLMAWPKMDPSPFCHLWHLYMNDLVVRPCKYLKGDVLNLSKQFMYTRIFKRDLSNVLSHPDP